MLCWNYQGSVNIIDKRSSFDFDWGLKLSVHIQTALSGHVTYINQHGNPKSFQPLSNRCHLTPSLFLSLYLSCYTCPLCLSFPPFRTLFLSRPLLLSQTWANTLRIRRLTFNGFHLSLCLSYWNARAITFYLKYLLMVRRTPVSHILTNTNTTVIGSQKSRA